MILVTGSTGNVGGELVVQLAGKGHAVRAIVRNAKEATGKLPTTVDIAVGDFGNVDSLAAAMRGVAKVYSLVPFTAALAQHDANVLAAAVRAGVKHVVKHSVLGAQWEGNLLGRWHRAGEKALEASGLAWTFVRPGGFSSNALQWLGSIKQAGAVFYPTGDGKLAPIDPRDIAAVAAVALTQPGHEGKAYDVTGPAALTTGDQVAILAKALGKDLKYVDVPDAAARESMLGMGMPALVVDALLEFTAMVRAGQAAMVTDTVERVTGTPARTFETWVRDHLAAFK